MCVCDKKMTRIRTDTEFCIGAVSYFLFFLSQEGKHLMQLQEEKLKMDSCITDVFR